MQQQDAVRLAGTQDTVCYPYVVYRKMDNFPSKATTGS